MRSTAGATPEVFTPAIVGADSTLVITANILVCQHFSHIHPHVPPRRGVDMGSRASVQCTRMARATHAAPRGLCVEKVSGERSAVAKGAVHCMRACANRLEKKYEVRV